MKNVALLDQEIEKTSHFLILFTAPGKLATHRVIFPPEQRNGPPIYQSNSY